MLKVKVTEEHIKNGERQSFSSCAVALALKDATGKRYCGVLDTYCKIFDTLYDISAFAYTRLPLPDVAQNFIINFDLGNPVEPFEFELEYTHEI